MSALADAYLNGRAVDPSSVEELAVRLGALVAASGVAPAHAVAFVRHVGRLRDDDPAGDGLATLAGADLGLAFLALEGDAAAVSRLFVEFLPQVAPALGRLGARRDEIDELVQRLQVRVLVGEGDRPARLREYTGRGSLRRWLRASLIHSFLNARRDGGREIACADDQVLDALAGVGVDPEMEFLKARYRGSLEAALRAAITELQPEHKLVLRYTYVDGLGLDALRTALRVSRATAHRRLQAARDALRDAAEAGLARDLGLEHDEVASLRRMVRSQVEVSVRRLLGN